MDDSDGTCGARCGAGTGGSRPALGATEAGACACIPGTKLHPPLTETSVASITTVAITPLPMPKLLNDRIPGDTPGRVRRMACTPSEIAVRPTVLTTNREP